MDKRLKRRSKGRSRRRSKMTSRRRSKMKSKRRSRRFSNPDKPTLRNKLNAWWEERKDRKATLRMKKSLGRHDRFPGRMWKRLNAPKVKKEDDEYVKANKPPTSYKLTPYNRQF